MYLHRHARCDRVPIMLPTARILRGGSSLSAGEERNERAQPRRRDDNDDEGPAAQRPRREATRPGTVEHEMEVAGDHRRRREHDDSSAAAPTKRARGAAAAGTTTTTTTTCRSCRPTMTATARGRRRRKERQRRSQPQEAMPIRNRTSPTQMEGRCGHRCEEVTMRCGAAPNGAESARSPTWIGGDDEALNATRPPWSPAPQ
jgi:hypothetical protein